MLGTVILALGVTVISIVFIFGFKPTEFISDFLYDRQEKKNERKEERAVAIREQRKQEERRPVKSNKIYNVEEDIDIPRKETKKERRLREEEERRRQALEVDQLTINNLEEEAESKGGLLKKFKHNKDDIVPLGMKDETSKQAPDFIEENLFKQEQETKEEKVKEVLQLEHTLTVEDENYEFPPITFLSEGEKKGIKGGKKAVTDTASKLQKTLYSFGVSAKVENVSVGPAITRYELKPAEGVRVSKIANLADDIALNLAAETIRIEAPIPGKQAVGIEVPNKENEIVHLRDIIDIEDYETELIKINLMEQLLEKDSLENIIIKENIQKIQALIQSLPSNSKEIFILSRKYNLKNKDIAIRLGISVKTVEYHITKTLAFFRKNMEVFSCFIFLVV